MSDRSDSSRTRPEPADGVLKASWQRSQLAGLDPAKPMDPPVRSGIDVESRLFRSAKPVLKRIRGEIAGERLSVMLVGDQAEMLTTVNGCSEIDAVVERIGARPGAIWREDTTGTNALATPFETRRPFFVKGRQHYVEGLHEYSCYGRPIFNPLTSRLIGVLDVMTEAGSESALMRPFIDTAIMEIERSIRESAGSRTKAVIGAFEDAATHPAAIVVAVSSSAVLQSAAAARVLTSSDITMLRDLAAGLRGRTSTDVELANGGSAAVKLEAISGTDGVLVRIQARQRPFVPRSAELLRGWSPVQQWFDEFQESAASAAIVGEGGSGRSTALKSAVGARRHCRVDGRLHDPARVDEKLRSLVRAGGRDLIAIDDLDQLSAQALADVERLLSMGAQIVATSEKPGAENGPLNRILDLFDHRQNLPALRECRSEIVSTLNELAGPGVRYRFTPQATRILESYSWPGNHRQLASVTRSLAALRGTLIDVADLPPELRSKATTKAMTPWQQASCDVLIRAMEICHGNKAHAADYLGISRSTLYHHIKEYGIVV
ncbi:helix-turn-helix domain-containing protein [Gordonia sp. FQ]|uniref:helix-turn-helix domain-containing protein n=1 Tax=Gordonia sp. FQ TaxID=3446634 RepID=UPI003F839A10